MHRRAVVSRAARGDAAAARMLGTARHRASPNASRRPNAPAASARKAGNCARHWSSAKAQRGAKVQPGGRLFSAGTMPGISFSRLDRIGGSAAHDLQARDRGQQAVGIGVERLPEQRVDIGLFDLLAGIHDDDPLRRLGDDAEIVGDQDDRGAELPSAIPGSGRGSAPGSSRRARSSARRRSAPAGCRPAPSRSSRAAACRRTADAGIRAPAAPARGS